MSALTEVVVLAPCAFTLVALIKFLYYYMWAPLRIQHVLNSQGIKGPPYRFIHGNNEEVAKMRQEASGKPLALSDHAIFPKVHPHMYSWINKYGKNYLAWDGVRAELVISDPELIKEVLKNSEKTFRKRKPTAFEEKDDSYCRTETIHKFCQGREEMKNGPMTGCRNEGKTGGRGKQLQTALDLRADCRPRLLLIETKFSEALCTAFNLDN